MITAMNLVILIVALTAAVVFTVAVAALVELLRHDGAGRSRDLPRSHPADEFDPYAQRFGRAA